MSCKLFFVTIILLNIPELLYICIIVCLNETIESDISTCACVTYDSFCIHIVYRHVQRYSCQYS